MNLELEQVLTQILAFLIMLWILKKFAWKPLLEMMEKRRQHIRSEFDSIEQQKKETDKLLDEYHTKLRDIEAEARKKIQEATSKGHQIAHDIEQQTRHRAAMILNQAQEEMKRELAQSKEQLKREIINISLAAAEKVIQENLDSNKHQKLIENTINQTELK